MIDNKKTADIENALSVLRDKGFKVTPQRRAVLAALSEGGQFCSAQIVLEIIRSVQPDVSLDTVYRNLNIFKEIGVVHEIVKPGGNVYEIITAGHHHHHLICTECGKMECIDICPMNNLYEKEAENRGFLITGHVFEFYGLCRSCQRKQDK